MTRIRFGLPATAVPSLLAALATWVTLWAWGGFVESPSRFLVPAFGGCLVVAVTGMLLRSARVPSLLVVLLQVLVVTSWLAHGWAPQQALGGWIPTPEALTEMGRVLEASTLAAQSFAAPVADEVPAIFPVLVLAGTATAIIVDFLACGLRRVPVAGIPLLAVYTAPVSILGGGVPWWGFAAGALAFLALLADDEGNRLAQWGRQVSGRGQLYDSLGSGVSTTSVRASARKIGLTATGLAVVAPIVIPTLSGSILPGNGPGSGGDGDAVTISNPLADLRRDLVRGRDIDLLEIETNGDPSYLRISVLDAFTGNTWKPSGRDIPTEQRADGRLPRPPGLAGRVARSEVEYQVRIGEEFSSLWLPTPYPVRSIEATGDWRYDAETFDFVSAQDDQTTAGMDYTLTALEVAPTAEQLVDAGPAPDKVYTTYTDLPDRIPELVRSLSREVTAGLDSKFEKAVALQRWFRDPDNFTYSLERSEGNGTDDLVEFLGTGEGGRVGYCEQFAAAMAVMGRVLGIPSRVAVGFLSPDKQADGSYVYSAHDLHAWPEMYFDDVGWVRFEPTPQDRADQVPGYTTGRLTSPEPEELPSSAAPSRTPEEIERNQQPETTDAAAGGGGAGGNGTWMALLGVVAMLGLVVAPRAARSAVRRRRWATATTPAALADAAWRELRDSAVDLGLRWDDTVTLRTRARDLAGSFGAPASTGQELSDRPVARGPAANLEAAHALERLVGDLERARYAREMTLRPGTTPESAADSVAGDVELCVDALRNGASRRRQRVATWLPASLVRNREWRATGRLTAAGRPLVEAGVDRAT